MNNPVTIVDQDITKQHKQRNLKSVYLTPSNAEGYREYDDKPYDSYAVKFGHKIEEICNTFDKSINILDIACGTGRYFHRLQNVQILHGVDFSIHMLEKAKNPTRVTSLDWWKNTSEVKLFCNTADDYCRNSKTGYYDFIYSIGAIAEYGYPEGIIATRPLFNNIARILSPGGIFLFTVHEQNYTTEGIKEFLENTLMSKMQIRTEDISFGDWSHTLVTIENTKGKK